MNNVIGQVERKIAKLRANGYRNIMVIGDKNGSIRISSIDLDGKTVIIEISINKPDNWLKDYFVICNSINRIIRNLNRSCEVPIIPDSFGDGAVFGPSEDSALLYLERFNSYPENGEIKCEEPFAIEKMENGGNPGLNDYSALLIVEALLKEVD